MRVRRGCIAALVFALAACAAPAAPRPLRYVAVGASDSVGVGSSDPRARSWPSLVAAQLPSGAAYTNVGVSGSTVSQALVEQLPKAAAADPDVVTVWLAFNDLARGVAPTEYGADLARLLDGLLRTNARIFVGNLPDLRGVPALSQADRALMALAVGAYNAQIAGAVRERGPRVVLVDLYDGSADVIARELVVSADGLHPNDLGYQRIAERFVEALRRERVLRD